MKILLKAEFKKIFFYLFAAFFCSHLIANTYKPFDLDQEFPNYLAEDVDVNDDKQLNERIRLIENVMHSILKRVQIPHIYNGKFTRQDFIPHLWERLLPLVPKESTLSVFVSGGVVRTLIAYIYKEIYKKKYKAIWEISTEALLNVLLKDKKPLDSTFVFGVGSDFDMLMTLKPKDPMAEEKIKNEIINFVNSARSQFNLGAYSKELIASLVPAADVKDYHEQINRVVEHGGSGLDILAFELSNKEMAPKIIEPEKRKGIVKNLIAGFYEYWPDETLQKEHPKTLRGLRPLFELPFLKIKDKTAILSELHELLAEVKKTDKLDRENLSNYEKMMRNAYFSGARNRAYREQSGEPAAIAKEISEFLRDKLGIDDKVKRLLPEFLSYERIVANRNMSGLFVDQINHLLIPLEKLKTEETNNGFLYHGTTIENGLSILRNGFVISNLSQGAAAFGPGVYTTKDINIAKLYGDFIIKIKLRDLNSMRILNWKLVPDDVREKLKNESMKKEFSDVFDLLREEYAIDIILNKFVLVQNLNAIKLDKNLGNFIDALGSTLALKDAHDNPKKFLADLEVFLGMYRLGNALGAKLMSQDPAELMLKHYDEIIKIPEISKSFLNLLLRHIETLDESLFIKYIGKLKALDLALVRRAINMRIQAFDIDQILNYYELLSDIFGADNIANKIVGDSDFSDFKKLLPRLIDKNIPGISFRISRLSNEEFLSIYSVAIKTSNKNILGAIGKKIIDLTPDEFMSIVDDFRALKNTPAVANINVAIDKMSSDQVIQVLDTLLALNEDISVSLALWSKINNFNEAQIKQIVHKIEQSNDQSLKDLIQSKISSFDK